MASTGYTWAIKGGCWVTVSDAAVVGNIFSRAVACTVNSGATLQATSGGYVHLKQYVKDHILFI